MIQAATTTATTARPRPRFSLAALYAMSIATGARFLRRRPLRTEGIKWILNPASFPRPAEFRLALYQLAPHDIRGRVLDIGSPKKPSVILARQNPRAEFLLTDIFDDFVATTRAAFEANGMGTELDSRITLRTCDARQLELPDESIDWVYSVSVIEHVADVDRHGDLCPGDSVAMREIARVLKPGGVVTLTVPYENDGLEYVTFDGNPYQRDGRTDSSFYERHYDARALAERIIEPSGLVCEAIVFFGEPGRIKVERTWNRIPMKAKLPFLPFQGLAGDLLFRQVPGDLADARGVAIRLVKPGAP